MDENGNDREAKIAELKALWKRTGGEEMWRWPLADSDMRYRLGRGWDDYRRFEDEAEDGEWKKDLVGEELFVRVADIPEPDRKDHLPIAQGKMECPLCRGARQVYVPHVGLSTGVKARWPARLLRLRPGPLPLLGRAEGVDQEARAHIKKNSPESWPWRWL